MGCWRWRVTQVMQYLGPAAKTLAQVRADVLPRLLAYHARHRDFGFWAAESRSDREFIGWFGLRPVTPTAAAMVDRPDAPPGNISVAELGYRLRAAPGARDTRPRELAGWFAGPLPSWA
jgi:hypothetical protein